MDELHLKHPFFGSRMMTQTLKAEGSAVNRKRVQRLMRLMGLPRLVHMTRVHGETGDTRPHSDIRGTAHRAPAETNLAVPRTLVLSSTAPPGPPPESATDCRIGSRYVGTSRAGVRI